MESFTKTRNLDNQCLAILSESFITVIEVEDSTSGSRLLGQLFSSICRTWTLGSQRRQIVSLYQLTQTDKFASYLISHLENLIRTGTDGQKQVHIFWRFKISIGSHHLVVDCMSHVLSSLGVYTHLLNTRLSAFKYLYFTVAARICSGLRRPNIDSSNFF